MSQPIQAKSATSKSVSEGEVDATLNNSMRLRHPPSLTLRVSVQAPPNKLPLEHLMPASPPLWLTRLTDLLLARRIVALVLALGLTILAWGPASRLTFEQSIESLYSADNPRLAAWRDSKRLFGGDEFVMVAYSDPNLFGEDDRLNEAARDKIEALAEQLGQIPGIQPDSVQHLAAAMQAPIGRAAIRKLLEGVLVGSDGQTTAIVCRLIPLGQGTIPRAETYRRVRQLGQQQSPTAFVVGEPIQVHEMFRNVEDDGRTLGVASTGLLMVVIFVLFRSLRWMLLPLIVVEVTLIWTKGLLVATGMQLSMVSSMLHSLVTIIGIATTMHVTVRFREYRLQLDATAALRQTLLELIAPIFWTIATTAAGFAALLTSHITPVASFGIMMSVATLLVPVAAAMILPGGILLAGATDKPGQAPAESRLTTILGQITEWVEHRPVIVGAGMMALTTICTAGLFFLKVETDFSKNFRDNSPVVKALDFFETRLGGAGNWEVNFPAPREFDNEFLAKVSDLAADLRQLEAANSPGKLTKVVAVTDGLDVIPKFLPLTWRLGALERMQPDFISSLYNPTAGRMRIVLRARERQPSETKLKLIDDVEEAARKHFPDATGASAPQATGLFVLLTYLIESLMDDQLSSFVLAAAAIVFLMWIAFGSLKLGAMLLIPNLFPIALVIGTMGWIGLPVNIATAMIASVSMGLTVDSSIHYLAGYRDARQRGLTFSAALKETHQGVGLALVFANVALVAGFSVLTLSHFIPLVYFGVLVSVAMLGGLLGNLILLPLLLRIVDRNQ